MENCDREIVDSQIITENVGFLEQCFNNSFSLQPTLLAIKEYVTEEGNNTFISKKICNNLSQNKTIVLDANACNDSNIEADVTSKYSVNAKVINKHLKDWGLPLEIVKKYEQRGIAEMFEWQVNCLGNPKVLLDCCNLVYSAPTSAGKTLVAEILTIKTILECHKKVIIILPFVSIVREKMFYLQDILSSSGIIVEGFMGAQSPPGGLQAVHLAICTIEKANSLVNRLLDEGNISELGAVIVDELHLLGDPHRGYILELLLTKIKYVSSKLDDVQIQIVGMSATLPNLDILAKWLDAELFITDFRPIPLDEYCLVESKYFDKNGKHVCTLEKEDTADSDYVLKICLDTIKDGCSVLIFCMTKNRCENLAQSLASSFYKHGCAGTDIGVILRSQLKTESILEVLEQLKNSPVGLDHILKSTISFGVAYHHAGLTFDERDIIEGGFKSGAIRVLVATSTLSSGVNLPARKVIIRSPVFQRQPINILTYKQMIGRAGRMGKDVKGESILICTEAEKKVGFDLMMGALEPVKSCIESEDKYMRAVLEMIASQVVCTKAELDLYSKCTLLYTQQNDQSQNFLLENTLDELINYELVRIQSDADEKHYVATALGKACLSSSMAPNDGLSLFCELQKARQCLVLETDLHLIYLVTPYSVSSQWGDIDWLHLLTLWESLTKAMKRVGELVGIQESFIIRCLRGGNKLNNAQNKANIHKRFYTALALQDLVNEVPLSQVANKFQCARGFLQSLQQAAATFAGMVTAFCRQLGWKNMEMLISQFQDRLHFGIHSELLELMKLSSLNGVRARSLFDAGLDTIATIASADVNVIENALHKAVPFQSEKERDGDDCNDIRKRNKMRTIWITGCCGMTTREAAENLITEARKFLEHEIGMGEIKWGTTNSTIVSNNVNSTINAHISCAISGAIKEIQNSCVESNNHDPVLSQNTQSCIIKKENVILKNADINEMNMVNTESNSASINFNDNTFSSSMKFEPDKKNTLNFIKECTNISIDDNTEDIKNNYSPNLPKSSEDLKTALLTNEVVWDTLNFTESTLENIKPRTSRDFHSPNISFGDIEEKFSESKVIKYKSSKSKSTNDVSLFSSEGDNSSLFEESLPLDSISSKIVNGEDMKPTLLSEGKGQTTDYINIECNTILNAFQSTLIDVDEDVDIKLRYDDGDKAENDIEVDVSEEVIFTQKIEEISIKSEFISPLKREANGDEHCLQPLTKKMKMKVMPYLKPKPDVDPSMLKMNSKESITLVINIGEFKFTCYILRGCDVSANINMLFNIREVAIYVNINDGFLHSTEVIGSNIFKQEIIDVKNGSISNMKVMAIYFNNTCILFDSASLNDLAIKHKLSKWLQMDDLKLKVMSLKSVYIHLKRSFAIDVSLPAVDISLAEWLLDSDEKIPNITYLTKKYCTLNLSTISIKFNAEEKKFKNLNAVEDACVKAWSVWAVADNQWKYMLEQYIEAQDTLKVEIQVSKILSDCEYYGVCVDKDLAARLLIDVRSSQESLQAKAYKMCGYHFNFNSSKDVAKVLGMYKGRKVSTKKSVLTSHNSPLASIVIFWRKLNSILTKTLYPLTEKACIYTAGNRINPTYTMYTCTGRVSMHEPNLQNVPRTFSIPFTYLTSDDVTTDDVVEFNCRNIFRAAPGYVLISADYCQLEMRILTHYSEDPVLMKIMRSDVDVFKSIAATWSNVSEDEVDDDLRQKAKQLCYGILYGMGNKTLSQHLDVTELEAGVFMDSFYKSYPAIKAFTQSVIEECRKKGYVETLMKRRRFLPDVNSPLMSKKGTAERQAVNTSIQGSAADIAKAAMCAIDNKTNGDANKPRLILQMHDELIYEVLESSKNTFITVIKQVMEDTVRLKVPLPVKVKMGYTWGTLEEVKT